MPVVVVMATPIQLDRNDFPKGTPGERRTFIIPSLANYQNTVVC
jgi:hypothetical protein